MMRKDNLLSALLEQAALLLMAATALVVTSCTQDNDEPGNTLPEGKITLVPTVAPVTAWSTADGANESPNVAQKLMSPPTSEASLIGGEVWIALSTTGGAPQSLGCNYYSVSADGKLTRLPFNSRPNETEAPLSVDVPGQYTASGEGEVTLTTLGISHRAYVCNETSVVTIGTDGKFSMSFPIASGGLCLNVKNTEGTAYTGADVTATLKTVSQCSGKAFDVKTLTAADPTGMWGDIEHTSSVTAGDPLLELAVSGGKTYRVLAPRQITFTAARLYTFNVRVGATGITVSSDDLGIADFEAVAVTNAEAEPAPLYNGAMPNLLAIAGKTAYWVAPVDAKNASGSVDMTWAEAMATDVCPAGWHVPTMNDFAAMTGITEMNRPVKTNYDAIKVVFPIGSSDINYWSSTESGNNSYVWELGVFTDGQLGFYDLPKTNPYRVRCVRAK